MSWVTVHLGMLFNSGWAFEMSKSTACADLREIIQTKCSCQTLALLYL